MTGCEALSPTQLWKLNRHPRSSYGGDAYFSIPSASMPQGAAAPATVDSATIPHVAAF
jgi:hypothetical protein